MASKCVVCDRPSGEGATTYVLTEDEKSAIQALGDVPQDGYTYCQACQRLMQNREQGAQFLKGFLLSKMRASGVPHAEVIAEKFYRFLIERSAKKSAS